MSLALPGVISQRTAEARDLDDCAFYATAWSAKASRPELPTPSLTKFRAAAGNPDDPNHSDGLTNDQVFAGTLGCWPTIGAAKYVSYDWTPLAEKLRQGAIVSLAVLSSKLPYALRYGFNDRHRIGVAYDPDADRYLVANPLAPEGSRPQPCPTTTIRDAALAIGAVFAVVFPAPRPELPDTATGGDDVDIEFKVERWALDGGPGQITTLGAPIRNGKADYSERLALKSGTGDTNRRLELIARTRLSNPYRVDLNDALYVALAHYALPVADATAAFNEGRDAVLAAGAKVPRR